MLQRCSPAKIEILATIFLNVIAALTPNASLSVAWDLKAGDNSPLAKYKKSKILVCNHGNSYNIH